MTYPNYREQIKVVFFDIDETLYIKDQAKLPDSIPVVIRKLKQNGIIPAIATGRTICALPHKINELVEQEKMDLFVTINGQYNSYQGKQIACQPLEQNRIATLVQFFQQHQLEYAFVSEQCVAVSRITPQLKEALDPITTDYIVNPDYYLTHAIYQILVFYPEQQDEFIAQSGILGEDLKVVRWHPYSVDLLSSQGSKAKGIAAVAQYLGLQAENIMAFGDGLNDIEMMQYVGVSVAMGNAHPKVKEVATHTTYAIDQDGIYRFLVETGLIEAEA